MPGSRKPWYRWVVHRSIKILHHSYPAQICMLHFFICMLHFFMYQVALICIFTFVDSLSKMQIFVIVSKPMHYCKVSTCCTLLDTGQKSKQWISSSMLYSSSSFGVTNSNRWGFVLFFCLILFFVVLVWVILRPLWYRWEGKKKLAWLCILQL